MGSSRNTKKIKVLNILDNILTIVLVGLLSLNLVIYGLNKVALRFIGGD